MLLGTNILTENVNYANIKYFEVHQVAWDGLYIHICEKTLQVKWYQDLFDIVNWQLLQNIHVITII